MSKCFVCEKEVLQNEEFELFGLDGDKIHKRCKKNVDKKMNMIDEKCCCNCLHCARWNTSKGIECHCDIDDKYLGYLTVMDIEFNCDNWVKETKWDKQNEHDKQIYNRAVNDFADKLLEELSHTTLLKDGYYLENIIKPLAEQLKEKKNDD